MLTTVNTVSTLFPVLFNFYKLQLREICTFFLKFSSCGPVAKGHCSLGAFCRRLTSSTVARYNDQKSEPRSITASIIQGSVIGPASYVVTASDLRPVTPGNHILKYADDTVAHVPPPTAQRTEDLIVYSISSCSSCQL